MMISKGQSVTKWIARCQEALQRQFSWKSFIKILNIFNKNYTEL